MLTDEEWKKFEIAIEYKDIEVPDCCFSCEHGGFEAYESTYECTNLEVAKIYKGRWFNPDYHGWCKYFEKKKDVYR